MGGRAAKLLQSLLRCHTGNNSYDVIAQDYPGTYYFQISNNRDGKLVAGVFSCLEHHDLFNSQGVPLDVKRKVEAFANHPDVARLDNDFYMCLPYAWVNTGKLMDKHGALLKTCGEERKGKKQEPDGR